jgi:hypothetical protein
LKKGRFWGTIKLLNKNILTPKRSNGTGVGCRQQQDVGITITAEVQAQRFFFCKNEKKIFFLI